ncbi:ubiquinol-cytochrome C chaperone family protein [Magnetospirillum sp. UT-4]|uniref:ubiquinol-cytochrome C chaperone family protein n=1 Tax=Magnetospirillum sp. UT-4 TaxID=2681467 RepID=UPI001385F141|nr:ubiquinol-cytochrome C chaperone family protein [Magnetospirillum sp. UT-4]CAA7617839.1 conserved hypothetical protein [Magnetospirillum sp. UT-4]
MPFKFFRDRRRRDETAHALYRALVDQARDSWFYEHYGVPDTLEGRYDMIVLHAYLLLGRLGRCGPDAADQAKALSQATFDIMFADMDQNLREMGVTDLAVGRRVRRLAEAFYGRVDAYDKAVDAGGADLAAALRRNLYQAVEPDADQLRRMAEYVLGQRTALAGQADAALLAGTVAFAAPAAR